MNILETITLYWNEFAVIYDTVLRYNAYKIVTIVLPILFALGIVRSAYHYAKGNQIGDVNHSMFSLRLGDKLLILIGIRDKTLFRHKTDWDKRKQEYTWCIAPIGSHLLGMIFDIAIFTVAFLVLFLIWPGVVFICVTIGPLHICRIRNLRKKAFIANLKGDAANAS